VCVNCARENGEGLRPWNTISGIFPPETHVKEVIVPCTGRLQPEHLLRAIEAGADLICIVACEENNCHFLEGSTRARRRTQYVQQMLEEIEVGGERILLLHLPGSARQDMCAKKSRNEAPEGGCDARGTDEMSRYILAASAEVAERLRTASPNPLKRPPAEEAADSTTEESEENED